MSDPIERPEELKWVVSREFLCAGRWLVHHPGPNRPNKIAYEQTKEQADKIAAIVNSLEAEYSRLRADKERLLKALSLAFDYYMGPGACGDFTCNCGNCGICEMRDKTRDAINAARKEAGK